MISVTEGLATGQDRVHSGVSAWRNGPRPSLALLLSFLRNSISRPQAANLQDLYAKGFEPGQQALESRLIPDLAMDDGLDGLY